MLSEFSWECPNCKIVLTAWSEAILDISMRLHQYHERADVNDSWHLFSGRVQDPEIGTWSDWNDVLFLREEMKVAPFTRDERTAAELAARYKPKEVK